MRSDAAIRALITPCLRVMAGLLLGTVSAQAATVAARAPAADATGLTAAGAPEARSTFRFARPLPQPPMLRVVPAAALVPAVSRLDESPHPRPRAFRGACNSTTGC